jgi:hypothetical protein
MRPTALLSLRRKGCSGFFFALKIRFRPGVDPLTWVQKKASTLPLDQRSRFLVELVKFKTVFRIDRRKVMLACRHNSSAFTHSFVITRPLSPHGHKTCFEYRIRFQTFYRTILRNSYCCDKCSENRVRYVWMSFPQRCSFSVATPAQLTAAPVFTAAYYV